MAPPCGITGPLQLIGSHYSLKSRMEKKKKKHIFITDLLYFTVQFNIQCSRREYNKVFNAIPLSLLSLIQNHLNHSKGQTSLPSLQLNKIH